MCFVYYFFFFSSRRRHTRFDCDWSSDVCSSDLVAARLLDGTVLIAGGATTYGAVLRSAVSFDPETGTVSPVPGELRVGRVNASAATLLDGRVLIAGGSDGTTELASAEIYENYSHTFSTAATTMSVARQGHSAVLLPHNGGVLIVGGTSNGTAQAAVDLFLPAVFPDPFSFGEGEFTSTGAMSVPRAAMIAGPTSIEGFAFAAGGASDEEVYRFATIKTDTDDYAPGERAEITGSGWQPGEKVTLVFQEDPAVHDDYVLEVTADGSGNIYWNQWAPEGHDLGVRFYLTASDSRSRAQVTFTDAADTTTTVSTSPNPSAPGDTVTATASVVSGSAAVTQGLVKFYYGGANCTGNPGTQFGPAAGVALNSSGQASASTTALTNGVTVRACYGGAGSGSSALQTSLGTVVHAVVTNVATVTTVSSSSNPSTFGGSVTFNAIVTRTSGSGTPTGSVQFTIDGASFGAPVALGAPSSATFATATSASISTLTVGSHAVDAVYLPTGNFTASSDALDGGQVVDKADAVCTIGGYTGSYDATSHGAIGSCVGVGTDASAAGSSLDLGASFTSAPGGTAHWVFTGGANYNDQGGSVAIVIAKADAVCSIDGYSGIYDANAHSASGTCTGVAADSSAAGSSLDFGASFTNAPGGAADWSFTGGTNYNDQSGSVAIVIGKADALCAIAGYNGVYDGHAHGASGSCTGVDSGAAAGSSLNRGASFTNVPGGTATWAFDGGINYNDQGGSAAITIAKADATVNVSGYTGAYDAQSHGATGSATGVLNETLAGLTLGATFTDYPGGTAHWVFTDQTGNYNDASGDVGITISKANAAIVVNGYTGTYDAQPHGATGSATGVGGVNLTAGLTLGSSFTNVPGGTAHWTFAGGLNYNDANGNAAIVINKANAVCAVSGYDVFYDGAFHVATGACTGVNSASLAGLNLTSTTHKDAGAYTDNWTFTDVTGNYHDASGTVADTIRHWTTSGFYQPVDMSGSQLVWNTIKGGSTVPLKFNLFAGAEKKTSVGDVKGFAYGEMACAMSTVEADVEITTTGGTQLRYDGTAGQFIQNWQTPKTSGKCYMVRMTAQDGSMIDAYFKTK